MAVDDIQFDDPQLLRYSRQILLQQMGIEGQQRLAASHVLILGLGGLGSPVAMYLAAGGVGQLTLVDDDVVELSNLQRQIVHTEHDQGRAKVESARDRLLALNPDISVHTHQERLDEQALRVLLGDIDAVVDASDNFATRFLLNRVCWQAGVPLISGAAVRMEGQVSVFDARQDDSPCYQCLYRDENAEDANACSENGVLAPIVGVIGSIQAVETMKVLAGIGEPLIGRLLLFDGMTQDWRVMKFRKDPQCPVCGTLRE